ncbi:MAG: hypothetical protein ABIK89_12045 [Planctomycetota bacterium]
MRIDPSTMTRLATAAAVLLGSLASITAAQEVEVDDKYLWLEEIEGERALDWVREQNRPTLDRFESHPLYPEFKKTAEEILQDKKRIPYGRFRGGYVYNFWRDEEHVRGIWRRASLDDYVKDDVPWEVLLDFDQLAEEETLSCSTCSTTSRASSFEFDRSTRPGRRRGNPRRFPFQITGPST